MNMSEQLAIQAMYDAQAKPDEAILTPKPRVNGSPANIIIEVEPPKRRGRKPKAQM